MAVSYERGTPVNIKSKQSSVHTNFISATPPPHLLISAKVSMNCSCRNKIYYTNATLLLVWPNHVVIFLSQKQLINTFAEIDVRTVSWTDGPASGGKGSKGRNYLDCIRGKRPLGSFPDLDEAPGPVDLHRPPPS